MVLARPEIKSLTDLKNKRIGVETTALGALMLHKLLEAATISSDQVTVINLDINEQIDAWQSNKIDALITYEPVAGKILSTGASRLFDSRQIPGTIFDVLAIRSDVAGQYQHILKPLTLSHFKALKYFQHNPLDAAYRMARRMELTGPEVLKTFRGLELPNFNANHQYLSNDKNRLKIAAETLSKVMLEQKIITQTDSLERLYTDQYLPREL